MCINRIIIILLLLTTLAFPFVGQVVGVTDGDTIKVLCEKQIIKVRLSDIDCPEKGQPYGKAAKTATSILAFNDTVEVQENGTDRYGRTLGTVILSDGTNLNKELVVRGLAWWYKKYSKNKEYEELENYARINKCGLWHDSNPIPPWEWRKGASVIWIN